EASSASPRGYRTGTGTTRGPRTPCTWRSTCPRRSSASHRPSPSSRRPRAPEWCLRDRPDPVHGRRAGRHRVPGPARRLLRGDRRHRPDDPRADGRGTQARSRGIGVHRLQGPRPHPAPRRRRRLRARVRVHAQAHSGIDDARAAGVMIAPPSTLRSDDQIVSYYKNAAAAIGDSVPVVVQDYPLTFSVVMSPAVITRLVNEIPGIVALKHEDWPGLEKISALRASERAGGSARRVRRAPAAAAVRAAAGTGARGPQVRHAGARADRLGLPAQSRGAAQPAARAEVSFLRRRLEAVRGGDYVKVLRWKGVSVGLSPGDPPAVSRPACRAAARWTGRPR